MQVGVYLRKESMAVMFVVIIIAVSILMVGSASAMGTVKIINTGSERDIVVDGKLIQVMPDGQLTINHAPGQMTIQFIGETDNVGQVGSITDGAESAYGGSAATCE